jgi:diacylglycerol kinase
MFKNIVMKVFSSFRFAWNGLCYCFKTQLNFRIHLCIFSLVIMAGFLFNITQTEWLAIVFCGMLVLILEMINTALEYLCNTITTDFHPAIKAIKDISAGAVLVSAAGSVVIGSIIFIPKLFILLS